MEQDLHVRDRVGVQDFVLLENHTSEAEFLENLQKRFKEDLIYVRFSLLPDFALLLTCIKWNLTHRLTSDRFWFRSIHTRTSPFTGRIM